jgi:hypothetical protein
MGESRVPIKQMSIKIVPSKCASICAFLSMALVLSFSLAQSPSPSPITIKPADSVADGSILKPYKNAWKVMYAFPGKDPFLVGTWSDELSEIEIDCRHLLKRSQVATYSKYHITSTNINVFDPKTVAPVYTEFQRSDSGEWARRDFAGAVVKYRRGKSPDKTDSETGELKMDVPIFDYHGGMYGVLLATLPLKEGFVGTIPTLSEDGNKFQWVTFAVGKQESVEAGPSKQVMAWPVEIDEPDQSHSIFWLSKDAPYVIKLVNIIPKGKWVTVTLTMV